MVSGDRAVDLASLMVWVRPWPQWRACREGETFVRRVTLSHGPAGEGLSAWECVILGQAVARTSHFVQLPRSPQLLTFVPRFKPCLLEEYGTNSSFSRVTASECLKLFIVSSG